MSKVQNTWDKGVDLNRRPHEYLQAEDYYETNSVYSGRGTYYCAHCGGTIAQGNPSDVHKFYPEFASYRTHNKCSKDFLDSLRTPEDGPGEDY